MTFYSHIVSMPLFINAVSVSDSRLLLRQALSDQDCKTPDQACILINLIIAHSFAYEPNIFIPWAQSYASFKNQSKCWVWDQLSVSSISGLLQCFSPIQGSDWLALRDFILKEILSLCKPPMISLSGTLLPGQLMTPVLNLAINTLFH